MRGPWALALVAMGAAGCVRAWETEEHTVSADGVTWIEVDNRRGHVAVRGAVADNIDVVATSWGRASRRPVAVSRMVSNELEILEEPGGVVIEGLSPEPMSGWDLEVVTPVLMDAVVTNPSGNVVLDGLEGLHQVDGLYVQGLGLVGAGAFIAGYGGADLELYPYDQSVTTISAWGDVTLWLPSYLPYDLRVTTDPGALIEVVDLGFDDLRLADGLVDATRFPATILIDVQVTGGGFRLLPW